MFLLELGWGESRGEGFEVEMQFLSEFLGKSEGFGKMISCIDKNDG